MTRILRWLALGTGVVVTLGTAAFVVQTQTGHVTLEAQPSVWLPPDGLPSPSPLAQPVTRPSAGPEALPTPITYTGHVNVGTNLIYNLKIHERAVFITIDDGNTRDPRVLDLIRTTHLPVSSFLIERAVNADPSYWEAMASTGMQIENHTVSHARLTSLGYAGQRAQICGPQPRYAGLFGKRPTLFRPPYGAWNPTTLSAASACGLSATILWDATYGGGWLETWGGHGLRPGDIILLHYLPTLYDDLLRLMRMLRAQDLGVGLLESYLHLTGRVSPIASSSPSASARPTPTPKPSPSKTPSPSPSPSTVPSVTVAPKP